MQLVPKFGTNCTISHYLFWIETNRYKKKNSSRLGPTVMIFATLYLIHSNVVRMSYCGVALGSWTGPTRPDPWPTIVRPCIKHCAGNIKSPSRMKDIELFFNFHNKLNENTCSLTPYHGYIDFCGHSLKTLLAYSGYFWMIDLIIWKFFDSKW